MTEVSHHMQQLFSQQMRNYGRVMNVTGTGTGFLVSGELGACGDLGRFAQLVEGGLKEGEGFLALILREALDGH